MGDVANKMSVYPESDGIRKSFLFDAGAEFISRALKLWKFDDDDDLLNFIAEFNYNFLGIGSGLHIDSKRVGVRTMTMKGLMDPLNLLVHSSTGVHKLQHLGNLSQDTANREDVARICYTNHSIELEGSEEVIPLPVWAEVLIFRALDGAKWTNP